MGFNIQKQESSLLSFVYLPGDIVGVREGKTGHGTLLTTGVITHTSQSSIRLAIDEGADEIDGLDDNIVLQLHKLTSDVSNLYTVIPQLPLFIFGTQAWLYTIIIRIFTNEI